MYWTVCPYSLRATCMMCTNLNVYHMRQLLRKQRRKCTTLLA
jgi:hypothetical protein